MMFPIVCLKEKDKYIYGFCDEKKFKVADKKLVESGVFNSVNIIDSNGEEFSIKSVKNLGWAGPFLGFNPMRKGRQIKIDFELISRGNYTLGEFKKIILLKLKNSPSNYKEEIIGIIENSYSFKNIIDLFC